jgi:hypothetical protein
VNTTDGANHLAASSASPGSPTHSSTSRNTPAPLRAAARTGIETIMASAMLRQLGDKS